MLTYTNNFTKSTLTVFLFSTLSLLLVLFVLLLCCCKEKKAKNSASKSGQTPKTKSGRSESVSSYPTCSKRRRTTTPKKYKKPAYLDIPKNLPAVDKIFPFAEEVGAAETPAYAVPPPAPAVQQITEEQSRVVGHSFHTTMYNVNETGVEQPKVSKIIAAVEQNKNAKPAVKRRVVSIEKCESVGEKFLRDVEPHRRQEKSASSYFSKKPSIMMITLGPLDKDGQKSAAAADVRNTAPMMPKTRKQKIHYLELPIGERAINAKHKDIKQPFSNLFMQKKLQKLKQSGGYFDKISPKSPTDTADDSQAEADDINVGVQKIPSRKKEPAPSVSPTQKQQNAAKDVKKTFSTESLLTKDLYCGGNKKDVMMITMRPLNDQEKESIMKKASKGKHKH